MSDEIILKGSNIKGTFKELRAKYLRGEINLVEDKQSLYSATVQHRDDRLAKLLWYDYHFDYYMGELSRGAFIEKPHIVKDLKQVAVIKGEDSVNQFNRALQTPKTTG